MNKCNPWYNNKISSMPNPSKLNLWTPLFSKWLLMVKLKQNLMQNSRWFPLLMILRVLQMIHIFQLSKNLKVRINESFNWCLSSNVLTQTLLLQNNSSAKSYAMVETPLLELTNLVEEISLCIDHLQKKTLNFQNAFFVIYSQ